MVKSASLYPAVKLLAILTVLIAPWRYLLQHEALLPADIGMPFAPALSMARRW